MALARTTRVPGRRIRSNAVSHTCLLDGRDDPDLLLISRSRNELRIAEGYEGGHRTIGIYFSPSKRIQAARYKRCRFNLENEFPDEWEAYRDAYLKEMRESYKQHRQAWELLLSWDRVVLACSVKNHERAARTVLARDILTKMGATYSGELP